MSLAHRKLACGLLVAVLMLGALASAEAQQPVRRRLQKLEFTEPNAPANRTNATETTEATAKKPALGIFDQSIRKPFDLFETESSLSGMGAMPPRTARPTPQNSKRTRELLDRKRNWVFTTAEDIYGLPTVEQMLKVPEYNANGEEKKPKTSLERYYERMEKQKNLAEGGTNQVKSDNLPSWLKPDDEQDRIASSKDEKANDRPLFGLDRPNSKSTTDGSDLSSSLLGSFGSVEKSDSGFHTLGGSGFSLKPVTPDPAAAERMQAFKQLLGTSSPGSPGLGGGLDLSPGSLPGASPLKSPFSADMFRRDSFSQQPAPQPSTVPSLSPALTLPSYSPAIPPSSVPPVSRTPTPPANLFELPKRKY